MVLVMFNIIVISHSFDLNSLNSYKTQFLSDVYFLDCSSTVTVAHTIFCLFN